MTKTANIAEFKDKLSYYLNAVEQGDDVIICKRNLPVAKITGMKPPLRKNKTKLGFDPSVQILGDITGPAILEEDWNCLREDIDSQ